MNKQVIDCRPGKGMTTAQSNEHLRKYSDGAYQNLRSNNFDPTRAHFDFENFEIAKEGKIVSIDIARSIPQRMRENIQTCGVKDPNEGLEEPRYRTIANIILGGSREQIRNLVFGTQIVNFDYGSDNSRIIREKGIEDWAKDAYNYMAKKMEKKIF